MNVSVTNTGHAVHITLSRPEQANAFNGDLLAEMTAAIKTAAAGDARALIISGEGKNFCGGADLKWFLGASGEDALSGSRQIAAMLEELWNVPFPVIAAVHGACYGGGVGLAAAADICVATASAKFCCSEVKIGLIPAIVSPYIARAIGERQAARYFMSAEVFDAEQAKDLGLVHELVANDKLSERTEEIAAVIAANAPQAVRNIKQRARAIPSPNSKTSEQNARALADAVAGAEAKLGIAAFFDKKPAPWQEQ